jgi:hypothetical protein
MSEQQRIRNLRREIVPKVLKLRNARRTVVSVRNTLGTVENNTRGLVDPELWGRAKSVLSELESELGNNLEFHSSRLHPVLRKLPAGKVRWELVLKDYMYELPSMKKKAVDQWLYKALNDTVEKKLAKVRISKMTRYRIMSALLKPLGLTVDAMTLKLHFQSKKIARRVEKL